MLVALLQVSSSRRAYVYVLCHILAVLWVGPWSVIGAFLGHTHLFSSERQEFNIT